MLKKIQKYKLSYKLIAKYMGYETSRAFYNSSAKNRILKGIERIIEHVENITPKPE